MTSREFYRLVDDTVRPSLKEQGFERLKITSSAWFKPLDTKYVLLHIYKGSKEAYGKPFGGKFNVWFHLIDEPVIRKAHGLNSISFLRYYSDGDLLELKKIRQQILRRILDQTVFESELDKELFDLGRPIRELGFNHSFIRNQPWPLEYFDSADVTTWAAFLVTKVSQSVIGIKKDNSIPASVT